MYLVFFDNGLFIVVLVAWLFKVAVLIYKYFLNWVDVFPAHEASNSCIHGAPTFWSNGCYSAESPWTEGNHFPYPITLTKSW